MSLYLVSVIAFLAGVFLCGIFGIVERFRLSKRVKALQQESAEKDRELNSLRNLPVTSEDMGEPPSTSNESL
jgi:ATP adenylyltransferase